MKRRVTIVHNFYRGTVPSGENLSVASHESLVGEDVDLTVIGPSNSSMEEDPLRTQIAVIEASVGLPRVSRKWVDQVLATEPDCVHIENLTPLVPESLISALVAEGLPVFRRWRNSRYRCPSGVNSRGGAPCHDCSGGFGRLPAVVHACYARSRPASALVSMRRGMLQAPGVLHVPVSEFVATGLLEAGLDSSRLQVIPNWVPPARHPAPLPREDRVPEVLYLGSFEQAKGLHTLFDAWRMVEAVHPEVRLRLLGHGDMLDEVTHLASTWSNLVVERSVGYGEARDRVHDALAVVVPSVGAETFGRVAAEAMAEGTPVVVSDAGALTELVDGTTGRVYAAGDVLGLAQALRDVLDLDAAAYADLVAAARRRYDERYSPDAVRGAWLELYGAGASADDSNA